MLGFFQENELELIKKIKTVTYLREKEGFAPVFLMKLRGLLWGFCCYSPLTLALEHCYDGWLWSCLRAATPAKDRDSRVCIHGCVAQSPFFHFILQYFVRQEIEDKA